MPPRHERPLGPWCRAIRTVIQGGLMTRSAIARWAGGSATVATLVAALATAPVSSSSPQRRADAPAPPERPFDPPPALPGAETYGQYCASCHGPELEGASAGSLADGKWRFGGANDAILESIRDGRPGTAMAAFGEILGEDQIRELVGLIRFREVWGGDAERPPVDPDGAVIQSEKQTFRIEVLVRDLTTPWAVEFLPDGSMLISERPGRLRVVEGGRPGPEPVEGTPVPFAVQDGGFFDVELHPRYVENGWVYLAYSEPGEDGASTTRRAPPDTSMTVIVRGRIRDNRWVEEEVLFRGPPETYGPETIHYGARFVFDDEGRLFYSIGDRGLSAAAQDLSSPLGKVHRVHDDGFVPDDNPFVGRPGALPTIWTWGHRNPQGLSFDPRTGLLWESEHGPIGGDEVNVLDAGRNYGWAVVSHGIEPGITATAREGMEPPAAHWTPSIAPSAIHFYSGTRYPGWRSDLFVTGLAGRALRRLEVERRQVRHEEVLFEGYGRVRDVVTGPDGLLHVAMELAGGFERAEGRGVVVRLVPADPPWPPPVEPDDEGAPPLPAEESMRTIVLPPGYGAELVAREPLVEDPILLDFDADGRMWVVEMPAFAADDAMHDSRAPVCRVVVLEDEDDDGAADRRTVFADGLVLPRAIKTLDAGAVLVGEPPDLWLMRDTDGDLKADERKRVAADFGRRDANPEHNANSLVWGLDNWLYTSEHDWHLRFREGGFEVVPTLNRGQWGGSIDDAGRVYRNVNNGPLFVDLLPARYFTRNANLVRTRGLYEPLVSLEEAVAWPVRPTRGTNRGYRDRFFREDGSSRILQSAATPVVYRGDRLPAQLRGGVFVTDSTTNLLHWFEIVDDGTGHLRARDGFERGEIFASSDERLRPVSAASGPDGTLYVVDMYRGVVQDVAYQTEYLQDYIRRHDLVRPIHRGRIWRIVHESTSRDRRPALSRETPAGLVGHLSHPNGWWRDTAQQLLVQRGHRSVVPALRALALEAPDWRTRLHALGTLDGLDALDPDTLEPLLSHPSPEVRAWAIRWSETWLAESDHPLAAAVLRLVDDRTWTVRRQLAASIGELPAPRRLEPALLVLRRYSSDPVTVDAVVSGLRGMETQALEALLDEGTRGDVADAVAMLAGALARSGEVPTVRRVLGWAGEPGREAWQRRALLRGLDLGFSGGAGDHGGSVASRPRRAAGRGDSLALPAEPAWLTRLAGGSDEAATLARAVAARLDWPGKTTAAVEVAPLAPVEQQRFAAGRELYAALCLACHRADGRGSGELAPSLVGSPLLVGDPGIPARIVLAGMEGDAGLMPPLPKLTDGEIAAVLTWCRRAWGHTASAVDPEQVREIRGLTRRRDRPWTRDELLAAPPSEATVGAPSGVSTEEEDP